MAGPDDDDIIRLGIVELAHFKGRLAVSWSVDTLQFAKAQLPRAMFKKCLLERIDSSQSS